MSFRIGERILSRYKVIDLLPESGQAFLAIAKDLRSKAEVVLKQLKIPAEQAAAEVAKQRFQRERSLHIQHPRVVEPIDSAVDGDRWILVFARVEGPTLEQHVNKAGRLKGSEVIAICDQIAEGLTAMHAKGVVHRDIKPQNIIIHPRRGAHIIDLGIARVPRESTLTSEKGLLGSLPWMSPEQVNSPTTVGESADIYGIGAVMYFMLTGQPPIDESDPRTVVATIFNGPVPRPSAKNRFTSGHLDDLCVRLLDRNPRRRPQSAAGVRSLLHNQTPPSTTPAHSPRAPLAVSPVSQLIAHCMHCGIGLSPSARFCVMCGTSAIQLNGTALVPRCLACGTPVLARALADVNASGAMCAGCGRGFSPEGHQLAFTRGPAAGTVLLIPQGSYPVGRAQVCDRDLHISSRQLNITCNNGTVEVQHAGSVNITYVDQVPANHGVLLTKQAQVQFAGNVAIYTRK